MKEIEIPEGYEARIEGNKVIIELEENKEDEYELVEKPVESSVYPPSLDEAIQLY